MQTLELGRYDPLSQSVTTDHPCRDWVAARAGFTPPPAPPSRGGGGGGDDHLPGRLQLLIANMLVIAGALLTASAIAGLLEELRARGPA
jgi:hypothetical protein